MPSPEAATELATRHSAESEDQSLYLATFDATREAVVKGGDVEMAWLRLTAQRESVSPAVLAGFVEGLASTRPPVKKGGARA